MSTTVYSDVLVILGSRVRVANPIKQEIVSQYYAGQVVAKFCQICGQSYKHFGLVNYDS